MGAIILYYSKAWTGSGNLTAQDGDILTQEKWNLLVQKLPKTYVSDWINVSVSSTDPSHSNGNNYFTITHNLNTTNVTTDVLAKAIDGSIHFVDGFDRWYTTKRTGVGYMMKIIDNNSIQIYTITNKDPIIGSLCYACGSGNSGQYKVKVTAME